MGDRVPGGTTTPFDQAWLDHHGALRALAARMLADPTEAEDVVQEAFSRLADVDLDAIDDLRGWLVVVVRRRCLDRLRSARSRRESSTEGVPEPAPSVSRAVDPADRVTLDDQVQLALQVVLDRLSPAERTAFVLHDVFGFSFTEIAQVVGRTATACRQLASRARRSIRSGDLAERADAPVAGDRALLERFVAACAGGDLAELVTLLDPAADGHATTFAGVDIGGAEGRQRVVTTLLALFGPTSRRTLAVLPVDGQQALVAFEGGRATAVVKVHVEGGVILHLEAFVRLGR